MTTNNHNVCQLAWASVVYFFMSVVQTGAIEPDSILGYYMIKLLKELKRIKYNYGILKNLTTPPPNAEINWVSLPCNQCFDYK